MTNSEAQATTSTDQDKDELSIATTLWAADRTLLAWIRTSLAMITFGFFIHQAANFLQQEGLAAVNSRFMGLGLWIFGIIVLIFASWVHFSLRQRIVQYEFLDVLRRPLALIVAIVLCVAGSVGLIVFLVSQLS